MCFIHRLFQLLSLYESYKSYSRRILKIVMYKFNVFKTIQRDEINAMNYYIYQYRFLNNSQNKDVNQTLSKVCFKVSTTIISQSLYVVFSALLYEYSRQNAFDTPVPWNYLISGTIFYFQFNCKHKHYWQTCSSHSVSLFTSLCLRSLF